MFHAWVTSALGVLLTAPCGCSASDDEPVEPVAAVHAGLYSEVRDFAEVEANLPLLRDGGLGLLQVIRPDDFGSASLSSLIGACADSGIEFRAWIVLDEQQGYWPGESNVEPFGEAVDEFIGWVDQQALPVDWITFDIEPSWQYTEQLMAIAGDETNPDRTDELLDLIRAHHDREAFAAATAALGAVVDRVHDAGLQAHAVTYPVVIDDLADADPDIQDGLDTPIEGIDWDELTFMTYRSSMQTFGGAEIDAHIFYSYGRDAREAFGPKAGLDFGLVGTGFVTVQGGYEQPGVLATDVALARAAGIDRVHLYSFEGVREQSEPGPWLGFAAGPPAAVPEEEVTHPLRTIFAMLDAVLDEAP